MITTYTTFMKSHFKLLEENIKLHVNMANIVNKITKTIRRRQRESLITVVYVQQDRKLIPTSLLVQAKIIIITQ